MSTFPLQRVHVRRSLATAARQPTGEMLRKEKAPKSGKVRSAPLVDELIVVLDQLSKRDWFTGNEDLVFCNEVGGHLSDGMLRRRFYEALDRAGLPRVRIHDLRHGFGTIAVQAFPITDVQGYLGHAHISTTMRYIHHTPGADAAARLQAVLAGNGLSDHVSKSPVTSAARGT
jgi:integrase